MFIIVVSVGGGGMVVIIYDAANFLCSNIRVCWGMLFMQFYKEKSLALMKL